jgi:hypothetical protein
LFDCRAEQDEMNNRAMDSARIKYNRYASRKLLSACPTLSTDITIGDYMGVS